MRIPRLARDIFFTVAIFLWISICLVFLADGEMPRYGGVFALAGAIAFFLWRRKEASYDTSKTES
jgi:hypothetical protein